MSAQSDALGERIAAFTTAKVKRLATNLTATLRADTPVETGNARAQWMTCYGDPPTEPVAGVAAAESAQESGIAVMAGYELEDGPAYVFNNAPYIRRLNDGSSTQRPAGFVESAIERELAALDHSIDATVNT